MGIEHPEVRLVAGVDRVGLDDPVLVPLPKPPLRLEDLASDELAEGRLALGVTGGAEAALLA